MICVAICFSGFVCDLGQSAIRSAMPKRSILDGQSVFVLGKPACKRYFRKLGYPEEELENLWSAALKVEVGVSGGHRRRWRSGEIKIYEGSNFFEVRAVVHADPAEQGPR